MGCFCLCRKNPEAFDKEIRNENMDNEDLFGKLRKAKLFQKLNFFCSFSPTEFLW